MSKLAAFFRSMLEDEETGKLSLAAGRVTKVECARSGEFTAMGGKRVTFTPAKLRTIAENFGTAKKAKIGHGKIQTDTPNSGDVLGLAYDEKRDRLIADVKPTEFLAAQNRSGAFDRVSMELVPKGDGYALDALSFLGAHDPAITDLEPVAFAAGEERIILSCAEEDGEDTVALADFTAEQRKKLAESGVAMPDGSFPIRNTSDLMNAIQAFGRASDPAAAKKHIAKRAKELNATDKLPADWSGSTQKVAAAAARGADMELTDEQKTQLAQAEKFKADNERLRNQALGRAEADAAAFLASDGAKKKIPLVLLKAGNLGRILVALAKMDVAGVEEAKIQLAAPDKDDPKKEVASSLYEGLKQIFLSLPEKTAGLDEELARRELANDEGGEASGTNLAGATEDSSRIDFAARKVMQAEKAKGNDLSYLDAVRRVQMSSAQ